MYVVYVNLLYFLSIFLFTYNKNLLSPPKNTVFIALLTTTTVKYKTYLKNGFWHFPGEMHFIAFAHAHYTYNFEDRNIFIIKFENKN